MEVPALRELSLAAVRCGTPATPVLLYNKTRRGHAAFGRPLSPAATQSRFE